MNLIHHIFIPQFTPPLPTALTFSASTLARPRSLPSPSLLSPHPSPSHPTLLTEALHPRSEGEWQLVFQWRASRQPWWASIQQTLHCEVWSHLSTTSVGVQTCSCQALNTRTRPRFYSTATTCKVLQERKFWWLKIFAGAPSQCISEAIHELNFHGCWSFGCGLCVCTPTAKQWLFCDNIFTVQLQLRI